MESFYTSGEWETLPVPTAVTCLTIHGMRWIRSGFRGLFSDLRRALGLSLRSKLV
jgi:hypothetical protein